MGQAKRRGTLQDRAAFAQLRNEQLTKNISGNFGLKSFAAKYGAQRLATRLVQCQAIQPLPPCRPLGSS